jgi:hypothetical protein
VTALGFAFAAVFWFLAALMLVEYELHVHVLPPWQRRVYGVAAFLAGLALAVAVGRVR